MPGSDDQKSKGNWREQSEPVGNAPEEKQIGQDVADHDEIGVDSFGEQKDGQDENHRVV